MVKEYRHNQSIKTLSNYQIVIGYAQLGSQVINALVTGKSMY
jgi:hypothetical protein